ncbi:Growth-regulating factor [Rhynchospora pubera]|uniref:Growth-regulating factor n=1 Tax=Rhynchospora pubera TaxID=906938 RepID=A0AAV8CVW1_9POAL|nr:Growth-regulating factor [Rhynchospora pubera]
MEKKRARDTSLCYGGSVYASNWKKGVYSFPSGASRSIGTQFTHSQWLELQKQALIYKHINASVPVPPYLLYPFHYSNAAYNVIAGARALDNLGLLVNSTDPEPRRCRRTDGKKWRCSKDAAPDQKYCERHMNRGKPRSRKSVEAPENNTLKSTTAAPATNDVLIAPTFGRRSVENSSGNFTRFFDSYGLFGNQEDKPSNQLENKGYQPRITEDIPDDDSCKELYHKALNLNYSNIKDYSFRLLDSDPGSMNEEPVSMPDQTVETRAFIDAWSAEKAATLTSRNCLASLDLPDSGLSLSMPNDQINLETADPFLPMQSPVTWTKHGSSLGGPLGEFFQPHQQQDIDIIEKPHSSQMLANLFSKEYNDSNGESPTRPVVLSPTGVLQKTLISYSDNSNVSSPNFVVMDPAIYQHQHIFSDFK